MTAANTTERYAGLDALRGLGASLVVLLHLDAATSALPVFSRGYLAVDLFFMLSGFVIGQAYHDRLINRELDINRYIIMRLRRLYPVILMGIMFGSVPFFWRETSISTILIFIFHILLIPAVWTGSVFPLNFPHWSLFFEILANAAHARLALSRFQVPTTAIVGVASIIYLWVIFHNGTANLGASRATFWFGIPRVMFGFFVGLLLFKFWKSDKFWKPRVNGLLPIAVGCAVILLPQIYHAPGAISDAMTIMLAFPAIIWLAACSKFGSLGTAVATFAGELSYPLYAIHAPMIFTARDLIGPSMTGSHLLSWLCVMVIIGAAARGVGNIDAIVQRWMRQRTRSGAMHGHTTANATLPA
jgi:peptidoglycan/LPS O-acetylase OafA/YrhL